MTCCASKQQGHAISALNVKKNQMEFINFSRLFEFCVQKALEKAHFVVS